MSLSRLALNLNRQLLSNASAITAASRCYGSIPLKPTQVIFSGQRDLASQRPKYFFIARSFSSLPSHVLVKLPSLSPTMETGHVVSWAKNEGDQVVEGDLLAEIETDKATMSMDSSNDGYIAKILVPAGTKGLPVGTPLVIIVEDKTSIAAFNYYDAASGTVPAAEETSPPSPLVEPKKEQETQAPSTSSRITSPPVVPHQESVPTGNRLFISPLARRLAKERGIDLSSLKLTGGSGPLGSFVAADIPAAANSSPASAPKKKKAARPPPPPGSSGNHSPYSDTPVPFMREVIAKRLTEAKQTIPHYYLTVDIELDAVMKVREEMNAALAKQAAPGTKPRKISVNDIVIKAMALANKAVPDCNSSWMGNSIRRYENVDVSVAVATPDGLITPIIFNADAKGLSTINQEVRNLAERAKENKLKPNEFMGGTITVSNLGMFGISSFSAIINPPQACILSVGGSQKVLVPDGDKRFKTVTKMSVTLCCDHRVVDGAVGATWLKEFKQFLESPSQITL
nr:Biotin lipoyl attachment [Hymenolepis microstoma]